MTVRSRSTLALVASLVVAPLAAVAQTAPPGASQPALRNASKSCVPSKCEAAARIASRSSAPRTNQARKRSIAVGAASFQYV